MDKIKNAASVVWLSVVRTLVPLVVGGVLGLFTSNNIEVDPELENALTVFVTVAFSLVYYLIIRVLEVYVAPKFGVLLGSLKSPDGYSKEQPVDVVARKEAKHSTDE